MQLKYNHKDLPDGRRQLEIIVPKRHGQLCYEDTMAEFRQKLRVEGHAIGKVWVVTVGGARQAAQQCSWRGERLWPTVLGQCWGWVSGGLYCGIATSLLPPIPSHPYLPPLACV